jgi:DNA-binding beta-propeller fold protein YncE
MKTTGPQRVSPDIAEKHEAPKCNRGDDQMRRFVIFLMASGILLLSASIFAQQQDDSRPGKASNGTPLKLVGKYEFPNNVTGRFDHILVDLKTQRLFTTPQSTKAVMVFDLKTRELIHTLPGIAIPHHLLYREDLNRLYVTDGGEGGALRIFDGKTYELLKSVPLLPDADPSIYDPATKLLYVENGGKDAKMDYSTINIINTTSGENLASLTVDTPGLDGMAIEPSGPRLYETDVAKNRIVVIDRVARKVIATWPITLGKTAVTLALDEPHHRLFVGCRSGHIIVFDTATGKELQALPINQGVDDLSFDVKARRLYAACPAGDGSIDVYKQLDPDHYVSLGQVPSGPGARTGELVSALGRYYVAVPQRDATNAQILEYQIQ